MVGICFFEVKIFFLKKRKCDRVFYYLTGKKKQALDFIVINNQGYPQMLIQVCLDLSNQDILKRELEPLISSAKYFNTKENLIITYNQEKSFQENGVSINAIPAWKWFLSMG
jgi:uncharacterized protein